MGLNQRQDIGIKLVFRKDYSGFSVEDKSGYNKTGSKLSCFMTSSEGWLERGNKMEAKGGSRSI